MTGSKTKKLYRVKLSVVIVNYNTSILIKNLLSSIYLNNSGIEKQSTEVILLDNGILDPCNKLVKDSPKVRLFRKNFGY